MLEEKMWAARPPNGTECEAGRLFLSQKNKK